MKLQVDHISIADLRAAFKKERESQERAMKSSKPQFAELHKAEIEKLDKATNSIIEVK